MIKVTILYPNAPGSHFDADYYVNVHMPLAIELLGTVLKGVSAEIGVAGAVADQPPAFAAVCAFTCESLSAFNEAIQPHASALQGDIPNYTDIVPIIQISELRLCR